MTSNKQTLKYACSVVLGGCLAVALVPRSAAGGNSIFAGPPASIAGNKQVKSPKSQYTRNCAESAAFAVETIPIRMSAPSIVVSSGESFTCSITVSSVPADGGYVQVNCDTPGAISNGSGSWPLQVYFAPGSSTTASFTLTVNPVCGSTTVNLYYGSASADPNNPDDWTGGGAVTIVPGC